MFAKDKVTQSMLDAVKKVIENESIEEATSEKVPTSTGMKVYGHRYGNSKKAREDQTKHSVDDVKGPKDKEVKEELKGNQDKIDANHNDKIDAQDFAILRGKKKVKEERSFADKLLETIRRSDVPAFLRKAKGEKPLTPAEVKAPRQDSISSKEALAKANEEVELDEKLDTKAKTLDTLLGRKKVPATYDNEHTSPKVKLEAEEVEHIEERDEGKPGKMFKKIAAKAAAKYGSKEAGNRVAGAIRKKVLAKEEIDALSEEQLDEMLNEVLGKDATAGDWIHDFVHSKNPKFAGKSKAERKKMALGAYYGKQNEETIAEKKDVAPGQDDAPFDPPYSTTPKNIKDKSGAIHTPMSRAKDLARQAFKKLKNETMMGKAGTTSESKKKW